ncbi:MAG: amidinotransferase [Flavobacteriaceae bacterium]|nr:amidinotransferase [Flavobacteriaceae bacterium]|tara:strand:+ start:1276 stop:2199 length:924 start_codon:yes stop_codon:yes gene_type:complete
MNHNVQSVLMIRPAAFRSNDETAKNNYFQNKNFSLNNNIILKNALLEFDNLVSKIKDCGITVNVFNDNKKKDTPDAIFPNNWITFHRDKRIAIYPMYAKNRRSERNEDVFSFLEKNKIFINEIIDYSSAENNDLFLEGTGSMVFDRINKKAYCSISERTSEHLIYEFCNDFEYMPIVFNSFQTYQNKRKPIYHTNVMMCLANNYCVICLDAIDDKDEMKKVIESLKDDNKEIITISETQLKLFAGNMIELRQNKISFLFMSETAYLSLDKDQLERLSTHSNLVYSSVKTIEKYGGGSVRCMIAEIFN